VLLGISIASEITLTKALPIIFDMGKERAWNKLHDYNEGFSIWLRGSAA
jgi:hypothetical protein